MPKPPRKPTPYYVLDKLCVELSDENIALTNANDALSREIKGIREQYTRLESKNMELRKAESDEIKDLRERHMRLKSENLALRQIHAAWAGQFEMASDFASEISQKAADLASEINQRTEHLQVVWKNALAVARETSK